jgi:hypothetical protein
MTTNPNDPKLQQVLPNGQKAEYLVLPERERAKGFVRPVRRSYLHERCGRITTMGLPIAETIACNPGFYGSAFCCHCGAHYPLVGEDGRRQFAWVDDRGARDGSFVGE